MTFSKTIRTIFPPITGYLTYLLCEWIWKLFIPTIEVYDDPILPGFIYRTVQLVFVVWGVLVFAFQYFFITPKTMYSIKIATFEAILIGLGAAILFATLAFFDSTNVNGIILGFIKPFTAVESYFIGNLLLIMLFNKLSKQNEIR